MRVSPSGSRTTRRWRFFIFHYDLSIGGSRLQRQPFSVISDLDIHWRESSRPCMSRFRIEVQRSDCAISTYTIS